MESTAKKAHQSEHKSESIEEFTPLKIPAQSVISLSSSQKSVEDAESEWDLANPNRMFPELAAALEPIEVPTMQVDSNKTFTDQIFSVVQQSKNGSAQRTLILALVEENQDGEKDQKYRKSLCNIEFKLVAQHQWAKKLWVDNGDVIRVIGTYSNENGYTLTVAPTYFHKQGITYANMVIVEPDVLVPTTMINNATSCERTAILKRDFKDTEPYSYPATLGNIIHGIFQAMLDEKAFQMEKIKPIVESNIKQFVIALYYLKKSLKDVYTDCLRAVSNITKWIQAMVNPRQLPECPFSLSKLVGIEQEFNTKTYGLKAKIDGTILVKDKSDPKKLSMAALEIKTGKFHRAEYCGQVLVYSLMLTERFRAMASEQNLLVYIMDRDLSSGNEVIRNNIDTLCDIIMIRNRLAKYHKLNLTPLQYPEELEQMEKRIASYEEKDVDNLPSVRQAYQKDNRRIEKMVDSIHPVKLPPLLTNVQGCKWCYSKEACALTALTLDNHVQRPPQFGMEQFDAVAKEATIELRIYFQKMVEALHLEQSADSKHAKVLFDQLKMVEVQKEGLESSHVKMVSSKPVELAKGQTLPISVSLHTENQINFTMVKIVAIKDNELWLQMNNTHHRNLTPEALNVKNPVWTIKSDAFWSHSAYTGKRNAIFMLCTMPIHKQLRDFIIEGKQTMLPPLCSRNPKLPGLNSEQKSAMKRLFASNSHIQTVFGLPGSGKTFLAIKLITELALEGKRVLVTGYSNQSLDQLLLKLKESFQKFLRVANSPDIVDPLLHDYVKTPSDLNSLSEISDMLTKVHVYACCAQQVAFAELLMIQKFDVVIVDDASLLNEPATLLPVMAADRAVLFGDHNVQKPRVKSKLAARKGLAVSMFERLVKKFAQETIILRQQMRMSQEIMSYANSLLGTQGQMVKKMSPNDQTALSERSHWLSSIATQAISLIRSPDIADTVKNLAEQFGATIVANGLIGNLDVLSYDKVVGCEFESVIVVIKDPLPRELLTLVTRAKKRLIFVQGEGESFQDALQIDQCICLC